MTRQQAFDAIDTGITRNDLGLGPIISFLHDDCPAEFDAIAKALAAAQDRLATRILHLQRLERQRDKNQQSIDFNEETDKRTNQSNRSKP